MTPNTARMAHFLALNREQQAEAIRRLALLDYSDDCIAAATRLSVEYVRRLLAARSNAPAAD